MYVKKYKIGELNRRVIFENWTISQDAGSGNNKTIESNFYQWAKIENRDGRQFLNQDQQQWNYDSKIIVRHNSSIVSTTTLVYENARYTIQSLSIDEEGTKRFMVLRCSKIDGDVVSGGTIIGDTRAYVFDYEGVGGETSFTESSLINKTIIGAFKDGQQFQVIFSGSLDATKKQVKYTASTGLFEWTGSAYNTGEQATIQYL